MNVDSMGGADGMVFVYDQPTSGAFWMKDTFLPLSIAFFGGDGLFIDALDMSPCTSERLGLSELSNSVELSARA